MFTARCDLSLNIIQVSFVLDLKIIMIICILMFFEPSGKIVITSCLWHSLLAILCNWLAHVASHMFKTNFRTNLKQWLMSTCWKNWSDLNNTIQRATLAKCYYIYLTKSSPPLVSTRMVLTSIPFLPFHSNASIFNTALPISRRCQKPQFSAVTTRATVQYSHDTSHSSVQPRHEQQFSTVTTQATVQHSHDTSHGSVQQRHEQQFSTVTTQATVQYSHDTSHSSVQSRHEPQFSTVTTRATVQFSHDTSHGSVQSRYAPQFSSHDTSHSQYSHDTSHSSVQSRHEPQFSTVTTRATVQYSHDTHKALGCPSASKRKFRTLTGQYTKRNWCLEWRHAAGIGFGAGRVAPTAGQKTVRQPNGR